MVEACYKANGHKYYEMILCYVDNVISISEKPMRAIEGIQSIFKLKGDKAEIPDMYLGARIEKVETASGTKCWTMTSEKYVKTAVTNVELKLAEDKQRLPSNCKTPFSTDYHPSNDTTQELDLKGT